MKATEFLKKAKELLSIETEEVKLAQAKLENGTVIEAEQMAEGQEVFIITEDEKVALPVGEYTLEDGQILMVKEEGIIASIGAAKEEEAAEEDLSEEQQLEEDKEEMKYATKQELSEVKQMIEEIKAMIDKKEDMASEVIDKKEELYEVPKVKHNPEKETEKQTYLFSQKSGTTTLDRVLNKISNN